MHHVNSNYFIKFLVHTYRLINQLNNNFIQAEAYRCAHQTHTHNVLMLHDLNLIASKTSDVKHFKKKNGRTWNGTSLNPHCNLTRKRSMSNKSKFSWVYNFIFVTDLCIYFFCHNILFHQIQCLLESLAKSFTDYFCSQISKQVTKVHCSLE